MSGISFAGGGSLRGRFGCWEFIAFADTQYLAGPALLPERPPKTYLWLVGNEGMDKKMETTIMGFIVTTIGPKTLNPKPISIRIHSFIPSQPKARRGGASVGGIPYSSFGLGGLGGVHTTPNPKTEAHMYTYMYIYICTLPPQRSTS